MTGAFRLQRAIPGLDLVFGPQDKTKLETHLYRGRFFKVDVESCQESLLDPAHFFSEAADTGDPCSVEADVLTSPRSCPKHPDGCTPHADQVAVHLEAVVGSAPGPGFAALLELLSALPLVPLSDQHLGGQTLGTAKQAGLDGGSSDVPACLTLHVGSGSASALHACGHFMQTQRPGLRWAWCATMTSEEAAPVSQHGIKVPLLDRAAPIPSIAFLHTTLHALFGANSLPGAALATVHADGDDLLDPLTAYLHFVAACAPLAPGGCLVMALPRLRHPTVPSLLAFAGALFREVMLVRPVSDALRGRGVHLVCVAFQVMPAMVQERLVCCLANDAATFRPVLPWHNPPHLHPIVPPSHLPRPLLETYAECCEATSTAQLECLNAWMAAPVEDTAAELAGIGSRWAQVHHIQSSQGGDPWLSKPWLVEVPVNAPRAGVSGTQPQPKKKQQQQQKPPVKHPASGTASGNLAGADVASGSYMKDPAAAAAPQTRVAADDTTSGLEYKGPLMTYSEAKGWEMVALVQSNDWPQDVPIPEKLKVVRYEAKPTKVNQQFWALHAQPAHAEKFSAYLRYLAKRSQSLGRPRMAVLMGAAADGPAIGLIAGSGRRPEELVGIMLMAP